MQRPVAQPPDAVAVRTGQRRERCGEGRHRLRLRHRWRLVHCSMAAGEALSEPAGKDRAAAAAAARAAAVAVADGAAAAVGEAAAG